MDGLVPSSFWQDQVVFVEPSYFGSPYTRTSVGSLPSGAKDIHELHVRLVEWAWSNREGDLLHE